MSRTIEYGEPFIYFHTHVVTREMLDRVISEKRSLEVDLSITDDGVIYVGHPLSMYEFNNLPPPDNLHLEVVVSEMKEAGAYLVIDCKDVRALPKAQQIIEDYGVEGCMLHVFTKALVFHPYSKKIEVQPHHEDEQITLEPILEVKRATDVPLALGCRGLSDELIEAKGEATVVQQILEVAVGNAEIVAPYMPYGEIPPLTMMETLLEHGVISLINVDRVPPERRPKVYLGATDDLQQSSRLV